MLQCQSPIQHIPPNPIHHNIYHPPVTLAFEGGASFLRDVTGQETRATRRGEERRSMGVGAIRPHDRFWKMSVSISGDMAQIFKFSIEALCVEYEGSWYYRLLF